MKSNIIPTEKLRLSQKFFEKNEYFKIILNIIQAINFCHKKNLSLGFNFDIQDIFCDVIKKYIFKNSISKFYFIQTEEKVFFLCFHKIKRLDETTRSIDILNFGKFVRMLLQKRHFFKEINF